MNENSGGETRTEAAIDPLNANALDRAVSDLVRDGHLVEQVPHEEIVGYLLKALEGRASPKELSAAEREERLRRMQAAARRAQELLRPYRQEGRSMVDELIAERRAEAARE